MGNASTGEFARNTGVVRPLEWENFNLKGSSA